MGALHTLVRILGQRKSAVAKKGTNKEQGRGRCHVGSHPARLHVASALRHLPYRVLFATYQHHTLETFPLKLFFISLVLTSSFSTDNQGVFW